MEWLFNTLDVRMIGDLSPVVGSSYDAASKRHGLLPIDGLLAHQYSRHFSGYDMHL